MFWKLKYHTPSAIDGLLEKELMALAIDIMHGCGASNEMHSQLQSKKIKECSLSQILDEDDILQECKSQNRKLIDFLIETENMATLVHYVTDEPSEDMEEKIRFKYPHIASEILTAGVFSVTEKLCENEKLIQKLWAFLDRDEQLNPLIGSFTSKVLMILLCQKPSVVFDYVQKYNGFVDRFLRHLNTSAMMDLLLQMVVAPDTNQTRLDLAKWLNDQDIVRKLLSYLHPDADPEQCYNASQALCDMLRLSRESAQVSSPAPLLPTLESGETVEVLLNNMFDADNATDNVILCGISYLLMLVDTKRAVNMFYGGFGSLSYSASEEPSNIDLEATCKKTLGVLLPRLKDFHNILLRNPKMSVQTSTIGTLNPPLGNTRLQTIHLITAIIEANDTKINQELLKLNTLSVLLELFFQYPWNNFLHSQVEMCLAAAFNASMSSPVPISDALEQDSPFDAHQQNTEENTSSEVNTKSTFLIEHIFTECHLIQKLLDGYAKNEEICKNGGRRQGNMGHLMRIFNLVCKHCQETGDVLVILQDSVDTQTCEKWSEFLKGPLLDHNTRCEANLGGSRPLASSIEESDEEVEIGYGQDNDAEKAYSLYQNMKFVNNFIDDFGHTDELITMEEPISSPFDRLDETTFETPANFESTPHTGMFETVCMERIQPFDDPIPPDDEEEVDMWTEKEFTYDVSYNNQTTTTIETETSSDEDDISGPTMIRELKTGGSSTDTDEDEEDEGSTKPSLNKPNFYTSLADDNAAPLLLNSEQEGNWPSDEALATSGVKPVPHGTIADWTNEPEVSTSQDVGWANFGDNNFGDQSSNVVKETTQSIVQEGEVPSSHLPEVAQSMPDVEDPANQGYSPLHPEDDAMHETAVDVPNQTNDEKSVEENTIVFDDTHEKSPEPLDEVPEGSTTDSDKSSQVQTNAGNIQVKLDSGMTNHQQLTATTDNNTTHSPESSGHNNQSPHKTGNNEQSLGDKSSDNISDKKLIEPSNEGEESSVLGLRFTGMTDAQSDSKINENTNEDGDLLEDNLDELLNTSRGSKYVIDSQEDSNEVETNENKDEDLENNFSFLSSGMLRGSQKTGNSVPASNSQTETIETIRAEAQEACQKYSHETHKDGNNNPHL